MSPRMALITAAILGGAAVGLGAFGAHAWKAFLAETKQAETFQTAVEYQMWHALALGLVGVTLARGESRLLRAAGVCFTLGVVFFSGALYGIVLGYALSPSGSLRWLGAVAPIGGTLFIVGWALLAGGASRALGAGK